MSSDKLTPKQERFIAEYLVDRNGMQAAIRAGYSANGAEVTASKLLRVPKVADRIAVATDVQRERLAARTGITQERVLAELEGLAFARFEHFEVDAAGNVTTTPDAPANAMAAIAGVKRKEWDDGKGGHTVDIELRFWDKPGSVKLAGRHVGLFPDRVEHTGKDGGPIAMARVAQTTEEMRRELAALLGEAPADERPPSRDDAGDDE